MTSLFRIGQVLKGRIGTYTITKELRDTVWFARNQLQDVVVIKSVEGHPRIENERDVLKRFQHRSPYIRPLVDEIEDPSSPATIVLRHLDSDLLVASEQVTLNRKELKFVARRILEAIEVLHGDGYVHTDVKLDNVFVNLRDGENRFSDVQLGDFGGCYPADSHWATSGTLIGAPVWSSPEVIMEIPWNTATDIWSFGTVLISLIYGGGYTLFQPKHHKRDDEEYLLEVFKRQYRYFGPFPRKIEEVANTEALQAIIHVMREIPRNQLTPFNRMTEREVTKRDNEFIQKMMKLDWRDRPTAKELLEDEWWGDDEDVPS